MDKISKKGIPLLTASRAVRYKSKMRFKVVRIFTSLLIATYLFSNVPVHALGTTNGSALKFEAAGAEPSLSFTHKTPLPAQKDVCLSLLHAARLSPGASAETLGYANNHLRPSDTSIGYFASETPDKKTASVALGLFLGVRLALGPQEVIQDNQRVQIGPELRSMRGRGSNYALAIASYRQCKSKHALKSQ